MLDAAGQRAGTGGDAGPGAGDTLHLPAAGGRPADAGGDGRRVRRRAAAAGLLRARGAGAPRRPPVRQPLLAGRHQPGAGRTSSSSSCRTPPASPGRSPRRRTWATASPWTQLDPGEPVRAQYELLLPATAPDGQYRLVAGLLSPVDKSRLTGSKGAQVLLTELAVRGRQHTTAVPAMQQTSDARFGDLAELLGFDLARDAAGRGATVTLYWRALKETSTSYSVFLHLMDEQGDDLGPARRHPAGRRGAHHLLGPWRGHLGHLCPAGQAGGAGRDLPGGGRHVRGGRRATAAGHRARERRRPTRVTLAVLEVAP